MASLMNKTQFLNAIANMSGNEFFAGMKICISLIFSCFSRKSIEVWEKWDYRFDIQLLGENQNRQNFL